MQILTLSVKQGWSCHHDARFSVAQLLSFFLSHFIATFELGQKMESHHLVPFAAAPTPFRKYAATRSLAWNGCFMHTDSKKQSLESFAHHCTLTQESSFHFWHPDHKQKAEGSANRWLCLSRPVWNSYLCKGHRPWVLVKIWEKSGRKYWWFLATLLWKGQFLKKRSIFSQSDF